MNEMWGKNWSRLDIQYLWEPESSLDIIMVL